MNEQQLAVMFGVVINMAYKALKQRKEHFGSKLFTKKILIIPIDEEEKEIISNSVLYRRLKDLLGMDVEFSV